MPIHLPPLSRRQFLGRSLVAGAALALCPEMAAARKDSDPRSWALFSDIHIAGDPAFEARGINIAGHFTAAASQVLALPKLPTGLIVTGDCAYNSGKTEDYLQLSRLLESVRGQGLPVHLALGNHDERQQFAKAFPDQKTDAAVPDGKQVSLLRAKDVNWFVLDSLEKTLSTPGLLGPEQLRWLAQTLDANPHQPAVVLVHHNPGLEGGNMGLKDTLALLEIIRPRSQVKAYIYGHTHSWQVEPDTSGLHLVNLPAVSYVFKKSDPSGWVHALVERGGMSLELRCIDPSHQLNGQTLRLKWRA